MIKFKLLIITFFCFLLLTNSCGMYRPVDAKKYPPNPELRVKKNLEEGKGFRLMTGLGGKKGGEFEFANSNPLWRASLDIIDFMPLLSVDYGGGIIITDWYGEEKETSKTLKFLRLKKLNYIFDTLSIKCHILPEIKMNSGIYILFLSFFI